MDDELSVSLPGARLAGALGTVPPGVELLRWDMTAPAPSPRIDLVVLPYVPGSAHLRLLDG